MLADDLRWVDFGAAGHPFVKTPHMDRIASEGERLLNVFATTALTSPSRASLLNLYPTVIDLCGLPAIKELSGQSLAPLLKNPAQPIGRVVPAIFDKGDCSATGARWHYIRCTDGSEELYDRATDPHEWTNLVARPDHAARKAALAKSLPGESRHPAPAAGASGALKKKKGTQKPRPF